jgi:hypothetical protein
VAGPRRKPNGSTSERPPERKAEETTSEEPRAQERAGSRRFAREAKPPAAEPERPPSGEPAEPPSPAETGGPPAAEPKAAPPAAESRAAPPAAESRAAPPAAESRAAPPAAESRAAPPAAESKAAPPAAESKAAPPEAESEGAPPPVTAEDMLDRLEQQAVELALLRGKLRTSERKVATERRARQRLEARMAAGEEPDSETEDLQRRLAQALERNRVLEYQVEQAWTQLGVLEEELAERRPHWWERRRRGSNLPPSG